MKNKKKHLSISLIFLLLTVSFGITMVISSNSLKINASSSNIESSSRVSTIPDNDSYVISGRPNNNYGDNDDIQFGYATIGHQEVYIHFNFIDRPSNWDNAEISLDVYRLNIDSDTFNVSVSLVETSWGESSITWNNKPSHGEIIKKLNMTEEKTYNINVSNYIEGEGISICINTSASNGVKLGNLKSKEGYNSESDAPRLIWTYEDSGNDEKIPSYPPIISLPVMALTMAGLLFHIRKKRN